MGGPKRGNNVDNVRWAVLRAPFLVVFKGAWPISFFYTWRDPQRNAKLLGGSVSVRSCRQS